MQLKNPFSEQTRSLFLYNQYCFDCTSNGNNRGGLELHHIFGRVSSSALNACVLCHECHSHVGHTKEEHARLFMKTAEVLFANGYEPNQKDKDFFAEYITPLL